LCFTRANTRSTRPKSNWPIRQARQRLSRFKQVDDRPPVRLRNTIQRGIKQRADPIQPLRGFSEPLAPDQAALERNARLDAEQVDVQTENGTVTLRGTVNSWADGDQAVSAAWAAPGVTRIKDHILVAY
jgi:hypothetical protein